MQFYGKTLAKNLETRKKIVFTKLLACFFALIKIWLISENPLWFKKTLRYTFCHVKYEKL